MNQNLATENDKIQQILTNFADFVLKNQDEIPLIVICGNSAKMIEIVSSTLKNIDVNFEETRYGRIRVNSLYA